MNHPIETRDVTLVLLDLVDSTALIQQLGDKRAGVVFARFAERVRGELAAVGGREIDHTDGFLLLLPEALAGLRFALAVQAATAELAASLAAPLALRLAIHRGEVVVHENPPEAIARGAKPLELEGLSKAVVARLCALAVPGQILLGPAAYEALETAEAEALPDAAVLRWCSHGLYRLKGVDDPLEVFEVGLAGRAPMAAPVGVDKAQAVGDGNAVVGWRPAAAQDVPGREGWVLQRRLGRGGFGEAWLAAGPDGSRRVFKFCTLRSRLRSLQREVALFGLLKNAFGERRDIVRLLDWRLDQPPFFLESEYVEGGDLGSWMQAEGGADAVPLGVRLELAAQVAEALAAAHAVGVLHKDVKPANVLIERDGDGRPRARLADFGVGAASHEARLRYGQGVVMTGMTELLMGGDTSSTAGTRLYMAPEQVEGRAATVQADVYAFGILLYQLVLGDFGRALAPGWEADVNDPLLREDLAALVRYDPAQRRGDLNAVARDLRALDTRRTQRAAAQAEAERLARARRLRRWLLPAFAGLLALVVVLGLMLARISAEAERANREAASAREVSGFLIEMFGQADPSRTRGENLTVREVLDSGVALAGERLQAQPEVRALLLSALGRAFDALGLYARARPVLEQSLETLRERRGDDDPDVAQARRALIGVLTSTGDYPTAQALADLDLERAREGAANAPLGVAEALNRQVAIANSQRDFPRSLALLEEAQALWAKHAPDQPGHAETLQRLAAVLIEVQRRDEAFALLEQALAIERAQFGEDDLRVASTLQTLGGAYRQAARLAEARDAFAAAEAIYRRLELTDHADYTGALFNVATVEGLLGRLEDSLGRFEAALALHRRSHGDNPYWSYALSMKAIGGTNLALGRPEVALPVLEESKAMNRALFGPDHIEVHRLESMIGEALVGVGRVEEGYARGDAAVAALAALMAADHDDVRTPEWYAEAAVSGIQARWRRGDREAAQARCRDVLDTVGARLEFRSLYNDVRRAKLFLCVGDAAAAAPLLRDLDAAGVRDAFLQRLRGDGA